MDQKPYLALIVPGGLSGREAKELVRRELRNRGEVPWEAMEMELFPGAGNSLLIARRRDKTRVYISAAALMVLRRHCP